MQSIKRTENEIFHDLKCLCSSPGFIHVISLFCYRDNFVKYNNDVKPCDLDQLYAPGRLVRNEISSLIGLLVQNNIDFSIPDQKTLQEYADSAERLLEEYHSTFRPNLVTKNGKIPNDSIEEYLQNGLNFRESIFYATESAYTFQYLELSELRYKNDSEWILANKGFSINDACRVVRAIIEYQNQSIQKYINNAIPEERDHLTLLPGFTFTSLDIAELCDLTEDIVVNVLKAFELNSEWKNTSFKAFGDYNCTNAFPIFRMPNRKYLLLQYYTLLESLYESPRFWFKDDSNQVSRAATNRGEFLESFCFSAMVKIFGKNRVFQNIELYPRHGVNRIGEIDVLVLYGGLAIVFQVKSKPLTLVAKNGDKEKLRDDFQKAIQNAYDQSILCSQALLKEGTRACHKDTFDEIKLTVRETYSICVTSENYPSLTYQVSELLKRDTLNEEIHSPLIFEIFTLDTITEFLNTPLHFISYLERRSNYDQRIMANHELTILAFHLKSNLWVSKEFSSCLLSDSICAELDVAVMKRKTGIDQFATPSGILTKNRNTTVWRILQNILYTDNSGAIEFGLCILKLSSHSFDEINQIIDRMIFRAIETGHSDVTLPPKEGLIGISIHCNADDYASSAKRLFSHAAIRKYSCRANKWVAVCIDPMTRLVRFGWHLTNPYIFDQNLEDEVSKMPKLQAVKDFIANKATPSKTGRNDLCKCDSGKKYKKCCGR